MKINAKLLRDISTSSFEKRVILFIVTIIIFIPVYLFSYPLMSGKATSKVDQIESRIEIIEKFLQIEDLDSRFPFKRTPVTISDILKKEIPDVSDLEYEIEELKDLIQSLQRDSHYHY